TLPNLPARNPAATANTAIASNTPTAAPTAAPTYAVSPASTKIANQQVSASEAMNATSEAIDAAKLAVEKKAASFELPKSVSTVADNAKLASSRVEDLSMSLPMQINAPETKTPSIDVSAPVAAAASAAKAAVAKVTNANPAAAIATDASQPELAMDGYCAVTVVDDAKWVEGSPEFGVIHLGKLYLFASKDKMDTFLAKPIPYTPMLNEIDVVRFFEERVIVQGKREWALQDPTNRRMFFFADKAAMLHFENSYDRYVDAAINVMETAVQESNP
ncbi:MAG: hypothetical protein WBD31_29285, partial [Rubripirellula sp.]